MSTRGGRVEIRIVDDGPGLPEAERHPLERAGETPLEHTSGLGLWLVKWLTDHYDGDVRFEATAGGTTVCLSVPRNPSREGASGSRVPTLDPGQHSPSALFGDD